MRRNGKTYREGGGGNGGSVCVKALVLDLFIHGRPMPAAVPGQ